MPDGIGRDVLQIDEFMGPTLMFPSTHTPAAHCAYAHTGVSEGRVLRELAHVHCTLSCGDAMMMDSRLLHCGGANISDRSRSVLYFSFADSALTSWPTGSTYSMRDDERGQYRLCDLAGSCAPVNS